MMIDVALTREDENVSNRIRMIARSTAYGLCFLVAPFWLLLFVNPFAFVHPWAWAMVASSVVVAVVPCFIGACLAAAIARCDATGDPTSLRKTLFLSLLFGALGLAVSLAMGYREWLFGALAFSSGAGVALGALVASELDGAGRASGSMPRALIAARVVAGMGAFVLVMIGLGLGTVILLGVIG